MAPFFDSVHLDLAFFFSLKKSMKKKRKNDVLL